MATGDEQPTTHTISQDDLTARIQEIEKRDSAKADEPVEANGAAAPGAPPVAAAPAADTPVVEAIDWGADGLQVDHGMLRGKKPEDVVKIVQSAQDKIRKQGEELALLRRASQSNAAPTQSQQATAAEVVATAPSSDPRRAEFAVAVFTDPERALDIAAEIALERSESRDNARRQQQEAQSHTNASIQAGMSAVEKIVAAGVPKEEAEFRVISAIAPELNRMALKAYSEFGGGSQDRETEERAAQAFRDVWKDEGSYLKAYDRVYGTTIGTAPQETISAPVVKTRADPPGATGAAPVVARPSTVTRKLDPEIESAIKRLGSGLKLSEEGIKRANLNIAARG